MNNSSGHLKWSISLCLRGGLTPKEVLHTVKRRNVSLPTALPQWELRHMVHKASGKYLPPSTSFPMWTISGIARKFAKLYSSHLEPPIHFFYFSFLACLGSLLANRLTLASEITLQPRFYILILGESADDRKSTAGQKSTDFFTEYFPQIFSVCYGVGSAEGLQKKIKRTPHQSLLLYYDEFKAFTSKCNVEASVLLPCVNTLFESNDYETQTKKGSIELRDAYLSIVGCSTIPTYENMWKPQFIDIGLCNRLFLVPGTAQRRFAIPRNIPQSEKHRIKNQLDQIIGSVGRGMQMPILPEARRIFERWYMNLERSVHAKRLDTYALRLMLLLAVNDGKTQVDHETVRKVLDIMDWQLAVRKQYDPIDADNEIAKMEEKIRRSLLQGPLKDRTLKRKTNAHRTGIWKFRKAIENLQSEGEIKFKTKGKSKIWRLSS